MILVCFGGPYKKNDHINRPIKEDFSLFAPVVPLPQGLRNTGHQVLDEHAFAPVVPLPQELRNVGHEVLDDPVFAPVVPLPQELRNVGHQVLDDPSMF